MRNMTLDQIGQRLAKLKAQLEQSDTLATDWEAFEKLVEARDCLEEAFSEMSDLLEKLEARERQPLSRDPYIPRQQPVRRSVEVCDKPG